jgi:hypothetical protein
VSPINVSAASSSIEVTAGESTVEIQVLAGQGPQGPPGPQGEPGEGGGGDFLPLAGGTMTGNIVFDETGGQFIGKGLVDTERGGLYGISLVCSVGYQFNWQAGWILATEQNGSTPRPLYLDSAAGTTLRAWDAAENEGVEIAHNGITFADDTEQTTAWTGGVAAEDVTGLATVATSGSYDDLDDLPTLFDGAYSSLTGLPALGTAAAAATTDFAAASHNQAWSTITSTPTTLSGYGITDAASSSHTHAQLHDRSHAITSSSDHTATAWRVFYSNASGVVTELALGSSGQALLSQGASAAPTWGSAGSTSASDLSSGTLANARLTTRARAAMNLYLWSSFR